MRGESCSDQSVIVTCECELACVDAATQAVRDSLAFARDCAADVPECEG